MPRQTQLRDGSILSVDAFGGGTITKDGAVEKLEQPILDALNNGTIIKDADGAVFFQRQLEHVKARSYDVVYADKMARTLFPVSNEGGAGVTSIVFRTYDRSGSAKIINAYADDLPRSDVSGKETTIPVRSVGNSYGYNIDEIQSSILTGLGLDQRRANAAREAVEETINDIAFFGDAVSELPGLFDNPNIPTGVVVDPGSGTEWVNKTPAQILFDINDAFADVFDTTKMKEKPNTLVLPPNQWSFIMSTPRSDNSDTTIAQYVVNNSPYIKSLDDIIAINEFAAVNNPELSADALMVYDRNPDKLQLEIPVELEYLATQHRNLEFIIPGRARVGGLNIYYPLSLNILIGI